MSQDTGDRFVATGDEAALADALKANGPRADVSGTGFGALIASANGSNGDDAATDAAPVRRVPALDEIMPPLDRKGKRGALNAEERDYKRRRALLAEVLGQMVPDHEELAARLAATEQELAEAKGRNKELDDEVVRLTAQTREDAAEIKSLNYQLERSREAHSRAKSTLPITLMATTQFGRLTGMELTHFESPLINNWTQFKILGHESFSITIQPTEQKLRITQSTGHINYFDLTDDGQIQSKDALAILALLGIERNLRDALSAMAVYHLFGTTPTKPEDVRRLRITDVLGGLVMANMFTEMDDPGPYGGYRPRGGL